ncbi:MAG: hypothetical protein Q8S00_32500 [Deltaproteobacteria bacterium]|nr:hypothetical protein [Deltaproteobacteria bacterium]
MSYSQGREEEILITQVQRLGIKKGNFLDIGAYTGIKFSNSRHLLENGWSGTLIEPSPSVFPKLKELYKDRKDVLTINAALVVSLPPINSNHPPGHIKFWDASGNASGSSTCGMMATT